jgi:hypothetical protein
LGIDIAIGDGTPIQSIESMTIVFAHTETEIPGIHYIANSNVSEAFAPFGQHFHGFLSQSMKFVEAGLPVDILVSVILNPGAMRPDVLAAFENAQLGTGLSDSTGGLPNPGMTFIRPMINVMYVPGPGAGLSGVIAFAFLATTRRRSLQESHQSICFVDRM